MADKFIWQGNTYCGDGTTSAAAASNGAVGAWNNINVFEGSAPAYGTAPANGDVVFIRSKDAAGADVTRTLSASTLLGKASLTAGQSVRWVLDAGVVWAGINGTLTYKRTANYSLSFLAGNAFEAEPGKLVAGCEHVAASGQEWCLAQPGVSTDGLTIDGDRVAYSSAGTRLLTNSQPSGVFGVAEHRNLTLKVGSKWNPYLVKAGDYANNVFTNLRIALSTAYSGHPVFDPAQFGAQITLIGGGVSGPGATTGVKLMNATTTGSLSLIGFQFPKTLTFLATYPSGASVGGYPSLVALGLDGGLGACAISRWMEADSRNDGYYPTLNAAYADTLATPWAWKVYPFNSSRDGLGRLPPIVLAYQDTAAVVPVRMELLIADTFTSVNESSVYMDVIYTDDATGETVHQTTLVEGSAAALTTSIAAWSASTYGAINLLKRKLVVTTQSAVRQNTQIVVQLSIAAKSASALDLLFVCPSVQLS